MTDSPPKRKLGRPPIPFDFSTYWTGSSTTPTLTENGDIIQPPPGRPLRGRVYRELDEAKTLWRKEKERKALAAMGKKIKGRPSLVRLGICRSGNVHRVPLEEITALAKEMASAATTPPTRRLALSEALSHYLSLYNIPERGARRVLDNIARLDRLHRSSHR